MLFNSIEFLVFFFVVFSCYWMLRSDVRKQNLLLLISSYIFYAFWDWRFLFLIILSSFIDYVAGIKIGEAQSPKLRKTWLHLSVVSNLSLLAVFKYYNFFAESFSEMMAYFSWVPNDLTLDIILPVGISFYTFQSLSYTIDIYRRNFEPTKNILSFFTFISFFPQLVAGPIERSSALLPQIENPRFITKRGINEGVLQLLIGLFRKLVIADTLGIYVDQIYDNIAYHNAMTIILATFFYAFQIYYDFAGYTDIAIGTAKLLGFKFSQNFNLPYFSSSLTEFWRRWHISLSTWLRDYVYITLGGSRGGFLLTCRNILFTMLLGGLWHGSSWNFLIWGGIHGILLCVEKTYIQRQTFGTLWSSRLFYYTRIFATFFIVMLAWVFFRSIDLETALLAFRKIISLDFSSPRLYNINLTTNSAFVLFVGISLDYYLFKNRLHLESWGSKFPTIRLSILCSLLVLLIFLFYSTSTNFIYFQF